MPKRSQPRNNSYNVLLKHVVGKICPRGDGIHNDRSLGLDVTEAVKRVRGDQGQKTERGGEDRSIKS